MSLLIVNYSLLLQAVLSTCALTRTNALPSEIDISCGAAFLRTLTDSRSDGAAAGCYSFLRRRALTGKENKVNGDKSLAYCKTVARYGEACAKSILEALAKQGKKLVLETIKDCLKNKAGNENPQDL